MIKLDYKLIRDEKDELKTYEPKDYPKEFNNLVYIKGPNSSGKSALLHIIALALYGNTLSKDELDPGLRRRIENLLDLDHNKLTFNLEISNPDLGLIIKSQKSNPNTKDIVVRVFRDGKESLYTKEIFNRFFRLLYTIPNNPTTQLPQLLNEIKVSQMEISGRITDFGRFLKDKIDKLNNTRDEATLANANQDLNRTKESLQKIENKLFSEKSDYEKLQKYIYIEMYLDSTSKLNEIHKKLATIETDINRQEANTNYRVRAIRAGERSFSQTMNSIEQEKSKILRVISKYKSMDDHLRQRYDQIESASITLEINKSDVQKTIRENLDKIGKVLDNLAVSERIAHKSDLQSLSLYEKLLSVLNDPKFSELHLPGTDVNVKAFRDQIKAAYSDVNKIQVKLDSYAEDSRTIGDFLRMLDRAISYRQSNPITPEEVQTENNNILDELNRKKKELNQNLRQYEARREKARSNLIELDIDPQAAKIIEIQFSHDPFIEQFKDLSDTAILDLLEQKKNEINAQESRKAQVNQLLQLQKRKVFDLEHQEIDPDREFLPNLNLLARTIHPLENKFRVGFVNSLIKIMNKENPLNFSGDDEKYSEQIGKYYAKKMKNVLHVGEEYQVESVNIVAEMITTTTGKKINFDDLGTGQSQSSYLTTKLGMTDGRMVIALFDEVAMMDENSLRPVVENIRLNYQKGKLLSSIIVQKAETATVTEL